MRLTLSFAASLAFVISLATLVLATTSAHPVTHAARDAERAPHRESPAGLSGAAWQAIQRQLPTTTQEAKLAAPFGARADDFFGASVAVSANTLVVGAPGSAGGVDGSLSNAGAAYVFERDAGGPGTWGLVAKLTASDAQAADLFGTSVAASGNTLVVGARREDGGPGDPTSDAGAAYIFERDAGGAGNWGQVAKLTAADAQADDGFGVSVAITTGRVVVGAREEDAGVGDPLRNAGAAYIFERDAGGAGNWGQVAKLAAADAQADDYFGISVAVSRELVVVGAYTENGGPGDPLSNSGAAYAFARDAGGVGAWGQVSKLVAADAQSGDQFGSSVAVSGLTVVVGAPEEDGGAGDRQTNAGAAYLFERDAGGIGNWGQVAKLVAADAQSGDRFGSSVAVSGDTVIIGARYEDGGAGDPRSGAGAAYLYERDAGGTSAWGQVTKLVPTEAQANDAFGSSVSVSGDTVVGGAPSEDGGFGDPLPEVGATYMYERNAGGASNWGLVRKLSAVDAQANDGFGVSVAVSGDTVVVGAPWEDGGADNPLTNAGAVYVFDRDAGGPGNWRLVDTLAASDAQSGDRFGTSVAVSGDTLVVGAWWEDGGPGDPLADAGAAYVFERDAGGAGTWSQVTKLTASDAQADDRFGSSVALSATTLIVGASREDGGPGDPLANAGAAYVFERDAGGVGAWGQVTRLTASDAQVSDWFGISVAISGDTLVVGALLEDGGPGDPLASAGAAYVFERDAGGAGAWGQVTKLTASDAQADDVFGTAVAVDGDRVIVGASGEDGGVGDPLPDSGAAYLFERDTGSAGTWSQVSTLFARDAQTDDELGTSVAVSGNLVIVGASGEDGGAGDPLADSGAAYLFERDAGGAGNWGQAAKIVAADAQAGDWFGGSVAASGDTLIAGARDEDGGAGNPFPNAGAAYIFRHAGAPPPTVTPTPSASPSATATPTATPSPSVIPSATATATPSATPTPSPTALPSSVRRYLPLTLK